MNKLLLKNILFAGVFLLISHNIIAQSQSIQVFGSAPYTRTVEKYTAEIILSNANYDYGNYKSLSDIKKEFAQFLKDNEFNDALFIEDPALFFLIDGYAEGTLYRFETTNKEEFIKLSQLYKIRNARINSKKLIYKPVADGGELAKKALEDARRKATVTAGIAGKKLGQLLDITDNNSLNAEGYSYYGYETKEEYIVTVKFGLE